MPVLVSFPMATVPSILGRRLGRAACAWTFLAGVAAYVLKDATQRGRIHSGNTFRYLRWGLIGSSGSHLLLVALKLGGVDGGHEGLLKFYPGALSCPRVAALSLLMHALVLFAALTPPPKVSKGPKSSTSSTSSSPASSAASPPVPPKPEPTPSAGDFKLEDKALFREQRGTVKYVGPTNIGPGEWIGLEMDEESGTHDGSLFGVRYFSCGARRGVFARASQLQRG